MDLEYKKEDFLLLVGTQIEKIRKEKNLSYGKIAKGCNIDSSDISKIAKGQVNIMLSSVLELSKGLNIHPKELFDFELEKE
ncbi:helix-turn-helix transcriptional regulator [Aureibaculum sp. 2210JD6-5]|uniref:helix-turn-helix domain-containing protein n=1 Tax=Aureibaculum sp. 2210JD6-5 TaxID=3103957 RepID=UPI002AAD1932|nr:helix-turn-helix transcriptional regulator [Aureibaculum sp. 2210JD6-5]MDY7396855.1 helix-turn-helix transcriptional regulator [Aureibaculum sp. 2210JD6-5]